MEGGDLKTHDRRYRGVDLVMTNHRYRGVDLVMTNHHMVDFFPPTHIWLGGRCVAVEAAKAMSNPIKSQMLMQRGYFPRALAALSLLTMLMGKGA